MLESPSALGPFPVFNFPMLTQTRRMVDSTTMFPRRLTRHAPLSRSTMIL
jgi:hypothetical protein